MKNIQTRFLSIFLVCIMVFQLFPVQVFAEGEGDTVATTGWETADLSQAVADDTVKILQEEVNLREEYTKHFTLDNGAMMAVVYPYAVHYEENGAWEDIDNTLYQTQAEYTVAARAGTPIGAVVNAEEGGGQRGLTEAERAELSLPPAEPEATPEPEETIPAEETAPLEEPTPEPETAPVDGTAPAEEATPEPETAPVDGTVPPEETAPEPEVTPEPEETAPAEETTVSDTVLQNRANSMSVFLPTSIQANNRIGISSQGYTLYFRPDGLEAAAETAAVQAAETVQDLSGNEAMTATKNESAVTYQGALGGADLRYTVLGQSLKEEIVIPNAASASVAYTATISAPGLTPVLYEDGSIEFIDDAGGQIFYIPAPMMYDGGIIGMGDVSVKLYVLDTGEYRLVYKPDMEWLQSQDRSWPVILDPTIQTTLEKSNFDDCYVTNALGKAKYSYPSTINLIVGNAGTSGLCRAFMRINNLPELGSSDVIVSANLYYYSEISSSITSHIQANVYKVTADTALDYTRITWNNQPGHEAEALDLKINYHTRTGYNIFNITRAVRDWYEGELNNGLVFASTTENTYGWFYYYAKENTGNTRYPKLELFYINTNGLDDSWDYTGQSLGRAGTAYVQNFSGNLLASRTDMSYGGNRMPASMVFSYSLADRETDLGYGNGWRSSYAQTLAEETVGSTVYYKWVDGDGTETYFRQVNGQWEDELGKGYTLTVPEAGTGGSLTITDKKDNQMVFDAYGRLSEVRDSSGNSLAVAYGTQAAGDLKISQITDGAGRKYTLTYTDGRLSSLSYLGTGTTALETVTYTYSGGDLTAVTYADGKNVLYTWSASALTAMEDIQTAAGTRDKLAVTYGAGTPLRAASLGYTSGNVSVGTVTFAYGENTTKVTDQQGRWVIYQFNNLGNTTAVYNNEGQALYGRYAKNDSTETGRANQLLASSRLQDTVTGEEAISVTVTAGGETETLALDSRINLLSNPDISTDLTGWTGHSTTGTDGRVTQTETRAHLDEGAIQISGEATKTKSYSQTIPLSGSAGDIVTFGGWAKCTTVDLAGMTYVNYYGIVRRAGIQVELFNGNTSVAVEYVPVNGDVEYWQFLSGSVTAPEAYTSAVFSFVYDANANTAWFDGAQLFREAFEYIYTYDDEGNLTSVKDLQGNITSYTYNDNNDVTGVTLPGGGVYSYTYDETSHLLTQTVSAEGVTTAYAYDTWGNNTSVSITDGTAGRAIRSDMTYTADGNMVASITGGDRNTITYVNDTERSLVSSLTDALNNTISYTYDVMRRLQSTTQGSSQLTNTYTDDLLASIAHSNTAEGMSTEYQFTYGTAGLPVAVKIGESWTLTENSYNTGTWTLSQQVYGNGDWWKYSYDDMDTMTGRYTNVTDTEGIGYEYVYDSQGQLVRVLEKTVTLAEGTVSGEGTLLRSENYVYDAQDRLVRVVVLDGSGNLLSDVSWTLDNDENVTSLTIRVDVNGSIQTESYTYTYNDDSQPTEVNYGNVTETTGYDGYGRITGRTVESGESTVLTTGYTYRTIGEEYTSTQVTGVTQTHGNTTETRSYTYDGNGNILTVSDGTNTTSYSYDSLGQLVWEYNQGAGKAWEYSYDLGGNILTKTEYPYAPGTDGTWAVGEGSAVSYTYGDTAWGDLLTGWNGTTISYDGVGNPQSWQGWSLSWQGGRQLAGMSKDGETLSFSYNESGLRTEKTAGTETHSYVWDGDRLLADVGTGDTFIFHYDAGGELVGYTWTSGTAETECILVRNLQGDVEKVLSTDGTVLASYVYDAWGNVLSATGTLAEDNPIRYRGYYYDTETGLYYLQSRYYDPAVGRFVNPDKYAKTYETPAGANMYAYCLNNPVNRFDVDGNWSMPNWLKVTVGAVTIAGLAVATVCTGGAAAVVCGAALSGAIAGGASGAVMGAIGGGMSGGWQGALDGACSGFMSGTLIGGVTGAASAGLNIATGATTVAGNAHGSTLHKLATNMEAGKMAASGQYSQIGINKSLGQMGLNGGRIRPDVIGIAKNGVNKLVEVVSPRQSTNYIVNKMSNMLSSNPGTVGKIVTWVRNIFK